MPVSLETSLKGNTKASSGFISPYLEVIDAKPYLVPGGDFPGGDTNTEAYANWITRDLTDVIWNDFATEITAGGVDIENFVGDPRVDIGDPEDDFRGEITLEAGTYYIEASAPALNVNEHVARLADTTVLPGISAPTVVLGSTEYAADSEVWQTATENAHNHLLQGSAAQTRSHIRGRFSLQSQRTLEVQHRCAVGQLSDGLGSAASFYESSNVFTQLQLWLLSDRPSYGRGSHVRVPPVIAEANNNSLAITEFSTVVEGLPQSLNFPTLVSEGTYANPGSGGAGLGASSKWSVSFWSRLTTPGYTAQSSNTIFGWHKPLSNDPRDSFSLTHTIDPAAPGLQSFSLQVWSDAATLGGSQLMAASHQNAGATATGADDSDDFHPVIGEWYHNMISFDGTAATDEDQLTWRVNGDAGAKRFSTSQPVGTNLSDSNRMIGVGGAIGSWGREMSLYNVGIWDKALSWDEMTAVYNDGKEFDLLTNRNGYYSSSRLIHYYKPGQTGSVADIGIDYATGARTPLLPLVQDPAGIALGYTPYDDDDIVAEKPGE